MRRGTSGLAVICLLVLGCGEAPAPSAAAPTPTHLPFGAVSQGELQSWIRFRLVYGLRADVDWVVHVARDPSAIGQEYNVPLLPEEFQRVIDASLSAENLLPAARRYAETFPTFAGAWLELPQTVIVFTDDVAERRTGVDELFGGNVRVRQVRYSLLDLKGFEDAVEAERDWLATIDVRAIDIGLDESDNSVRLYYEAPSQAVEARIRERLGGPDWVRFDWAGPPPWTGPYGRLEIRVVDNDGLPVPASMVLRPLDPRVVAFGPTGELEDGMFVMPAWAAVAWEVDVTYVTRNGERTITKEFTVPEDDVVNVRIVVDR